MRTIMMSLVLAAMSGCATVGGGVNTTFYRVNADDCGQTAPVPFLSPSKVTRCV